MKNGRIHFYLAKNALATGKINFSVGKQPLGDVTVTIEADDIEDVVEYMTMKE